MENLTHFDNFLRCARSVVDGDNSLKECGLAPDYVLVFVLTLALQTASFLPFFSSASFGSVVFL